MSRPEFPTGIVLPNLKRKWSEWALEHALKAQEKAGRSKGKERRRLRRLARSILRIGRLP